MTPRLCCWIGAVTAFGDLETTGLVAGVETKLRFGTAGAATFCLEARRAVRANDLEAIVQYAIASGGVEIWRKVQWSIGESNSSCKVWGNFWSRLPQAYGPCSGDLVGLSALAEGPASFLGVSDYRPSIVSWTIISALRDKARASKTSMGVNSYHPEIPREQRRVPK